MRRLSLFALPSLLAAAPADYPAVYKAGPPPLRLLPSTTPTGEQRVMPGAVVATGVLGRPDAAIVVAGVVLNQAGGKRTFARGDVLSAASVPGLPGDPQRVFCEEANQDTPGRRITGQMLFGLTGALRSAEPDVRYCLIDADGDAFFDHALLIGAKGGGKAPFAIPKAEYGLIEGPPLGGESTVKLRYVGSGGEGNVVAFDLEAVAFGRMRAFHGARHVVPVTRLPAHEIIAGAVVTVLAYDPTSNAATVVMNRDLAPGHIVLPETTE